MSGFAKTFSSRSINKFGGDRARSEFAASSNCQYDFWNCDYEKFAPGSTLERGHLVSFSEKIEVYFRLKKLVSMDK